MNNMTKGKVTFFKTIDEPFHKEWFEFDDILNVIKHSPNWLIEYTEQVRQAYQTDKILYKQLKKSLLPVICPSGCFNYRNSDPSNLVEYSNILILDFDWENPDPVVIENFRQSLIHYSTRLHLYAVWKSPAKGVKAALLHNNTDSAYHTELFISVKNKLFPRTDALDMTGKDVCRACYLSHDPDLFINTDPNLTEYQFQHDPNYYVQPTQTGQHQAYRNFSHTPEEIAKNKLWQIGYTDKTLMNMIIKACNAADPDYYKDGHRHKEVMRRAIFYCKDGILFENALWSLIGQFGENSRAGLNNADIESMVNSCYNKARADFGVDRVTFLSKRMGNGKSRP